MIDVFIKIRILDLIDIILVAVLLYQIYMIIRGTVAINIFIGVFAFYLIWLLVKALNMHLLSSILGQIIGVGVIALIIVFQQEIRRFFLVMVSRYMSNRSFSIEKMFQGRIKQTPKIDLDLLADTCFHMAKMNTGALIVLTRRSHLTTYSETGDILNAEFSSRLLESIFYKGNPLHDGAVIINGNKIVAARCVLPISDRKSVPSGLGLRHRAAIGMSENTDAMILVVSEEMGNVSVALGGQLQRNISRKRLTEFLSENLIEGV